MSLHEITRALARPLGFVAFVVSVGACAQEEVGEREATLGVDWSFSDEPGTRPREEAAGTGSMPDEALNVPSKRQQPPSDVLWTPKPDERGPE